MMNNNKILTVSYGTFSCTLEGFDDSFGTMKAIAEYFRDLASDDRYFGAEPPQPDAQMLASIAQREVSRRVEAREHEGKIVLSALEKGRPEQDAPAEIAHPVTATAPAMAAADHVMYDNAEADAAQSAADVADDDVTADAGGKIETADVAAETSQPKDAPAAAPVELHVTDHVAEDDAAQAENAEPENDIVPGQPDAAVEAFFDQAEPEQPVTVEPAPVAISETSAPASDSIAAKLQRIRAVVAQHDDDAEDEDYTEDEHAAFAEAPVAADTAFEDVTFEDTTFEDTDTDVIIEARDEIEASLNAEETASDEDVDDIADILRRLESTDTDTANKTTTDAEPQNMADVQPQTEAETDLDDMLALDTVNTGDRHDGIDFDNLFEDDTLTAHAGTRVDVVAGAETEADADTDLTDASDLAPTQATVSEGPDAAATTDNGLPRARVIKVKRADLEAAIEAGALEEYNEEEFSFAAPKQDVTLDDLAPARTANSSLSAEAEDELARELAALEADMAEPDASHAHHASLSSEGTLELTDAYIVNLPEEIDAKDDADVSGHGEVETKAEAEQPTAEADAIRHAKLPKIDDNPDTDRIAAEADSQMHEPEGATRRDAFAHLRAAVAAKKADDALGSRDAAPQDDAYRSDLADVVRPRRAASTGARTERPSPRGPAPLKLVAEQRIDAGAPAKAAGPISPRRVARAAIPADTGDTSFVDFASEMGASDLPDLLEAAAAYMSFVEQRDVFTRPQLMNKVRQAGSDGFNREDTLRSFGKLLREGKIEKIKAGQFAASDDIGFNPSRRAG